MDAQSLLGCDPSQSESIKVWFGMTTWDPIDCNRGTIGIKQTGFIVISQGALFRLGIRQLRTLLAATEKIARGRWGSIVLRVVICRSIIVFVIVWDWTRCGNGV